MLFHSFFEATVGFCSDVTPVNYGARPPNRNSAVVSSLCKRRTEYLTDLTPFESFVQMSSYFASEWTQFGLRS